MAGQAPRRSATQVDVARHAGVSTATVSRVLNGAGVVTPTARARVEAAIDALNYIPSSAARSLASKRSHTLGAIVPTLTNAIFAEGLNGFEAGCRARGYTMLLAVSNYDLGGEEHLVRTMIERGVEGIMLVGAEHTPRTFALLDQAATHHVCAWTAPTPGAQAPAIGFANGAAMRAVVVHLQDRGHERIGMLSGETHGNDRARERREAVAQALNSAGLPLIDGAFVEAPYTLSAARDALPALLGAGITALICGNDVLAVGALFEAQRRGLTVPDELAITGFDDLPIAAEVSPAITTVRVPAAVMGARCADALADALEANDPQSPPARVTCATLQTELIIRETT